MSSSVPDPADLTAFLEAQWDEDEQLATEALGLEVSIDVEWGSHAVLHHIHRWSSKRVLAEVAAKRAILDLHTDGGGSQGYTDDGYGVIDHCCETCGSFGEYGHPWPCKTLRALAAPFRGAPGWRNEWAIED